MPWLGLEPWERPLFRGVEPRVGIPVSDPAAWEAYPEHRWVYDKLELCRRLGQPAGPLGTSIPDDHYPVIAKPIMNLYGMGCGVALHAGAPSYRPGCMWQPAEPGRHFSIDVAVVGGDVRWAALSEGYPALGAPGVFTRWDVAKQVWWPASGSGDGTVEREAVFTAGRLVALLPGYTGMLNVEVIGGTVIDAHLRWAVEWTDLYGAPFLHSVAALYRGASYWPDERIVYGRRFSAPVWVDGTASVPDDVADGVSDRPGVSSVQVTVDQDGRIDEAQPPGGLRRVAIINGTDLRAVQAARDELEGRIRWQRTAAA